MNEIDPEQAQRAIDFFQKLCTNTKGEWAGQRFNLIGWQRDLLWELFGRVTKDGYRQYRTCYAEIPKKNGKSELAAGVALKCLVADGEEGGEVYSAANDREQASIVFNVAADMVRNSPVLSRRLDIVDSRKRIVDHKTRSFYQALSRETCTKHGFNPSAIIVDELHAHKTRELYDILVEGTDTARRQQLVFIITTAGIYDVESICWEVREHARQVRDGIVEDPSVLPIMYFADKNEDWTDETVWRRVNPSLDHIFTIDKIRKHYDEVRQQPSRENNFRRYRLNQWVSQVERWMPMDKWDECGGEIKRESLLKRTCYGGLDLSSSVDLSAFALLFPPGDGLDRWTTILRFFMPKENVDEKARKDGVPYDMWIRAGLIVSTPGNVIDYAFIREEVRNAAQLYDLRQLAYDPWGAVKLISELQDDLDPQRDKDVLVECRQGYKSLSPPTKELMNLVLARKLNHGNNPVLRWCADNVVVEKDPAENIKPTKAKAKNRIDGIVALIMALSRGMVHHEERSWDGSVVWL